MGRRGAFASVLWVAATMAATVLAPCGTAASAVGDFFWSGFNIADPAVDKARLEKVLYAKADPLFRSRNQGAIAALLSGVKWDEYSYFETASETGYVKENMRDVYGVFLSVDRVMRFKPSIVSIAGKNTEKHYTYVFVTLNIFAADSRNLVFSHPVFLTDVSGTPTPVAEILTVTLGKFAEQLKDVNNPFTVRMRRNLQTYFGQPGISNEAIRRTKGAIHPIDGYFENTFGVMGLCDDCVEVQEPAGMTQPDPKMMGDFARFFLNSRLAEFHQVAFLNEQARTVEERAGDAAATAKEGDIKRDWSELCLPDYDETGRSRVCVRVGPPRNPIWIGVRSLVKATTGAGGLITLRFAAVVDFEAELADRPQPAAGQMAETGYEVPAAPGEVVSNIYYVNALMKAINTLNDKTIH
ncbi:MAG: hypothetical protein IH626_02405 [Rhodospirillales bacterium]|nr:hypothetical protein [Rhodospirillales bacterium]